MVEVMPKLLMIYPEDFSLKLVHVTNLRNVWAHLRDRCGNFVRLTMFYPCLYQVMCWFIRSMYIVVLQHSYVYMMFTLCIYVV